MQPRASQLASPMKAIRRTLEQIVIKELPGVPVDQADIRDSLPLEMSAIYFLCHHASSKPFYIGRATDLRIRWAPRTMMGNPHHKHDAALKYGKITLHWWRCPWQYLAVAESILIRIYKPRWNSSGKCQRRRKRSPIDPMIPMRVWGDEDLIADDD